MGNTYVSVSGMVQTVEPGSTIDQRLSRSSRWRLAFVPPGVAREARASAALDGETQYARCAPVLMSDGSMGGCDLPLGHEGAHEYTPRDDEPTPAGDAETGD